MEAKITVEVWERITPAELVKQITAALEVRAGEVITPALALERARNIATGLLGVAILEDK